MNPTSPPPSEASLRRWLVRALLFALAYFALAELGHLLSFPGNFASFWPPNGLYLVVLLRFWERRWLVYAAALLANLCSDVLVRELSVWLSLSFCLANSAEATTGAWLLRRFARQPFTLARPRDLCALTGLAALIAPMVGASIATVALGLSGVSYWPTWQVWWIADVLGMLFVAPVLFAVPGDWLSLYRSRSPWGLLELGAAFLVMLVLAVLIFRFQTGPIGYLLLPVMMWIALRFEVGGIASATGLLALIVLWHSSRDYGPFAEISATSTRVLLVQAYLSVTTVSFLFISVIVRERRLAGLKVAESEELYRDLFENMTDLVQSVTPDGQIRYVNRAWRETLGYSDQDLATLSLFQLIHPEDHAHCATLFQRVLRGEVVQRVEVRYVTKEGRVIALRGSSNCRFEGGVPTATRSIFRDVTEEKKAEEALKQATVAALAASRTKSEFLANMSHEIRTPMNAIIGMAELSLKTQLTQRQRECIETVKSSSMALLGLINDILDFSKIEAGKLELDPQPFALRQELDELLKPLQFRAVNRGLLLRSRVSPDVPDALMGDLGRLRQVLVNLIGNAIKFTTSGEVAVQVDAAVGEGPEVELLVAVSDTGIGIPRDKYHTIFEPFTQADASTTRQFGGSGLGLSICGRLVALMGGNIRVESQVGRGSTFHFTVRFQKSEEPPQLEAPPPGDGECVPLRVLLAEDNLVNQRVATLMLEALGHHVDLVANGQEAFAALEAGVHDVVLMDMQMPVLDGLEATKAIRQREAQTQRHRVPIIALTANAMKGDRERCLAVGMDDYLSKPLLAGDLQLTLATMRQERRASPQPKGPLASPPPDQAPYAYEDALARVGGSEQMLREVALVFAQTSRESLSDIQMGLELSDHAKVERAAHKLKGSAGVFAASAVVQAAHQLESQAAMGQLDEAAAQFAALRGALEKLLFALGSLEKVGPK